MTYAANTATTAPMADLVPINKEGYDDLSHPHDPTFSRQNGKKMSNKQQMAAYGKGSYSQVPQHGNPSYTEAWALVEAARRMAEAIQHSSCDDKNLSSPVRESLRLNWRLWTIFQTEISLEDESPLPIDIRQNMLSLCNFVDKHTVDAISAPTPKKVSTLIEINRNIATGILQSLNNAISAEEQAAEKNQSDDTPSENAPTQRPSINEDI